MVKTKFTILMFIAFVGSFTISAQQNRQLDRDKDSNNQAENRLALVIGNGSYAESPLRNPVNDATEMSAALKSVGFEVMSYTNLDQNAMKRAIRDFGSKLRTKGGVGLFYYAGHGVQVKGTNYLIPVSATIDREEEVEYESVDLGLVLAQMESARNNMNIVILDACRNNPFARTFRSADKGLASINAPSGTLISYSTAPGSVALDGTGKNGLYTQELLKNIQTPNLTLEGVFKRVRAQVLEQTQGKQTPWESASLGLNDFYFVSSGNRKPVAPIKIEKQTLSDTEKQSSKDNVSKTNKRNDSFVKKELFFTFEVHKCTQSGTTVFCDLTITNNDTNDKKLSFHWSNGGRVFDAEGNEGKMDSWQIANKGFWDGANLLPDVLTKAKIRFKNVSSQAKLLKKIELTLTTNFSEGGSFVTKNFRVEFRDVPLQ